MNDTAASSTADREVMPPSDAAGRRGPGVALPVLAACGGSDEPARPTSGADAGSAAATAVERVATQRTCRGRWR